MSMLSFWRERKPYPPMPPRVGSLRDFWTDPLDLFTQRQRLHGDFVRTRLGGRNVFFVSDPDDVQHVLQKNNKNYVKSHTYDALRVVLGNGLLTSEGEFWLRQRKLVQP